MSFFVVGVESGTRCITPWSIITLIFALGALIVVTIALVLVILVIKELKEKEERRTRALGRWNKVIGSSMSSKLASAKAWEKREPPKVDP